MCVCLYVCLSVCLPVYMSACLFVCLFVCLSLCTPLFHTTVGSQPNLARIYADRSANYSNLNKFDPPHPRGSQGNFRWLKIQKCRKCHEVPTRSIILFNPTPHSIWEFCGQNLKSPGNSINCRENIFTFNPSPLLNPGGEVLGGHNFSNKL